MSDLRAQLFSTEARLRRFDWIVWIVGLGFLNGLAEGLPGPFTFLVSFALLFPQACLDAKRLHDLGLSAWWQSPVLLLGAAVAYFGGPEELGRAMDAAFPDAHPAFAAPLLLVLAYWGMLAFTPGTDGPNRFGPRPGAPRPVEPSLSVDDRSSA